MVYMRLQALSVACVAALLLGSCGAEDKSGACSGTMNGAYFRLEIGNFLLETGIDVRVNGRFIGKISKAQEDLNAPGQVQGSVKRLGEFPVCDKMVIDARGSSGTYTQRLCSKPAILSPACSEVGVQGKDFCWFGFDVVPSLPCTECQPYVYAEPTCPCYIGTNPGDAWEKC
jgi:hypothetical protein